MLIDVKFQETEMRLRKKLRSFLKTYNRNAAYVEYQNKSDNSNNRRKENNL